MVEPVSIVRQDIIESGDLDVQINRTEPEVQDSSVWLLLAEDELTEVTIERGGIVKSCGTGHDQAAV